MTGTELYEELLPIGKKNGFLIIPKGTDKYSGIPSHSIRCFGKDVIVDFNSPKSINNIFWHKFIMFPADIFRSNTRTDIYIATEAIAKLSLKFVIMT